MMKLQEEALKAVGELPEHKLETLIQFAHFLKESKSAMMPDNSDDDAEISRVLASKPVRHGGWVKKVWMSDDFNDSLEFVSDEEMQVLEAMRAEKKEAHEAAV